MSRDVGGSVRGNDQPGDALVENRCRRRIWSKALKTHEPCLGRLEAVPTRGGGVAGFRCVTCGAHHDNDKRLVVSEPRK